MSIRVDGRFENMRGVKYPFSGIVPNYVLGSVVKINQGHLTEKAWRETTSKIERWVGAAKTRLERQGREALIAHTTGRSSAYIDMKTEYFRDQGRLSKTGHITDSATGTGLPRQSKKPRIRDLMEE